MKTVGVIQKTVTTLGPELLSLDFRANETEEIRISKTNHQLYFEFVLKIRISFVSDILKSYKNPGRPKIRDSVN